MLHDFFFIKAAVSMAVVSLCACGNPNDGGDESATVQVAAAANLQKVLPALVREFERESGVSVELSFASSGRIAAQVEAGAPIDLVMSADSARIKRLVTQKKIRKASARVYVYGRLALVVRPDLDFPGPNLEGLADEKYDKIGMANPELAPYGAAAQQALRRAGLWNAVEKRLVIGENVGHVHQYWRSGNVDAAFVPLALLDERDRRVLVSGKLYAPLSQMLGLTCTARNPTGAAKLVRYLLSQRGQKHFEANGFARADFGATGRAR